MTVEGRSPCTSYREVLRHSDLGQANDIWIEVAQELGEQALCRALHHAGLEGRELGALFFTSVTGISSPSIDALLINRMHLPANIRRVPIFGLGCVAGAAALRARRIMCALILRRRRLWFPSSFAHSPSSAMIFPWPI